MKTSFLVGLVFILFNGTLNAQTTVSFFVDGVCGMCQDRIEKATKIKGVEQSSWDIETKLLSVTYDESKIDELDIHKAVAAVGHDTKKVKASDKVYNSLHGCCKYRDEEVLNSHSSDKTNVSTSFFVNGECGMCQNRIEKAAKIDGVKEASWDMESKMISVTYDATKINELAIHEAIAAVGHDTKKVKADDKTYGNLPGCCLYRENQETESQEHLLLKGKVQEWLNGKKQPLFGANVYWLETIRGITTDEDGNFSLERTPQEKTLVISYVGFGADTISITNEKLIEVVLSNDVNLKEFRVVEKLSSTEISKLNAIKIEKMNEKELQKAACCNLSESFETNPSVDVTYSDAITGTKQIQMLGLAGPNIQITNGNLPDLRGLTAIQGLTFVPGSWIKNIYLNKGTGSVINGYESVAGQINIELKELDDSLYVNLYGNQGGRAEANVSVSKQLNEHVGTYLHTHVSNRFIKNDVNQDGFLDNPLTKSAFVHSGWNYFSDNGLEMRFGIEGNIQNKIGGQTEFNPNQVIDTNNPWGLLSDLRRVKGWLKIGRVYEESPGKSMGLQLSASYYDEETQIGLNDYFGKQNSYYANYIYQNIIGTTDYTYSIGASFVGDEYLEKVNGIIYERGEYVPGVFGELTVSSIQNLKVVLGLRGDYHNLYGAFVTPRIHAKYDFDENTNLRFSIGRGQRTANIFSENMNVFAGSRTIIVQNDSSLTDYPYGLKPEIAWNMGANLTRSFKLFEKEGTVTFDYYRTHFENQIVVDWENPRAVSFYNLQGKSYSNSFQAQLDYELFNRFDVRLAYRYYDVKTTYKGEDLLQKPLLASNRAFVNLAYAFKEDKWLIDFTTNWIGEKRIPSTEVNPVGLRNETSSPAFFLLSGQVTKNWNRLAVYAGVENLLNFRQVNPIIDAQNPFGDYFDTALVWGPIFGRNIYAGLRYRF